MNIEKINHLEENVDIVIVGAGHAGCEAALACARLGLETILFTVSVESIAMMPCNPNIGGSSKTRILFKYGYEIENKFTPIANDMYYYNENDNNLFGYKFKTDDD